MAGIDIKQYRSLKAAGGITTAKLSEKTVVVSIQRFDGATGKPADPQIEQFNIGELKAQRDAVKENLADMEAFISDLETMNLIPPSQ